ncbi:phage major capsid protein [Palleronia sp. KMU-117]|uniref:phage major capsid protein n=1 Tax=Palleronia sp. KMU-117 TaxID=3434108 RepID=UPI003D73E895
MEETVTEEETVDEATKMLGEAMRKAIEAGDQAAAESIRKANEAVGSFLDAVADQAKAKAAGVKVEVAERKASFDVERVAKQIESLRDSKGSVSFELKTKQDLDYLAKSTAKDDLTGDVILPERDPEITRDPVREPFMEQIADTRETNSDYVSWVEVVTETGAPASTAELGTMPEKDFAFQEFKKPIEKITVTNKHSVELLQDGPGLVAEIKNFLAEDINVTTDTQLLSGNGTSPQLQGVLGIATTLDATAIGSQRIANANKFDVLRIAMTKIAKAGKGKFRPTHVILSPDDIETLDLTKDADGRYIVPAFYTPGGMLIRSARIIENTGITAGTFLVGDFRKLHVRRKGGVEIEITNADGTDFVKDIMTIKYRRRLTSYVRGNDDGAFQTGSFATCIAALVAA